MTRNKILFTLLAVLVTGGLAAWYFAARPSIPTGQSWRLPDGSEVSLAAVTYGQKHRVRYDHRWQDILSPLLPFSLQFRFGSRVASHTPTGTNAIVIWLWRRSFATPPLSFVSLSGCEIVAMDENGLESEHLRGPNCSYTLPSGDTLFGWGLQQYPRRSRQFGIRIYYPSPSGGSQTLVGDFKIPNRYPVTAPEWLAKQFPITISTNGLEVSLRNLETGLTARETGLGSAAQDARAFTRAEFTMREHGLATEDWSVQTIVARAASGETRPLQGYSSSWRYHTNVFGFTGALWPEERGWKLNVEVSRTTHFPPSELWTIHDVSVPAARQINKMRATTNVYGEDIEFLGLSSPNAKLPDDWTSVQPDPNLHACTPFPLLGTRLTLVEVRDDHGRKLDIGSFARSDNTGSRGATLRQTDYGFAVKIPSDAKTLDVTFAFTQSRFVEFTAKPAIAAAPAKP